MRDDGFERIEKMFGSSVWGAVRGGQGALDDPVILPRSGLEAAVAGGALGSRKPLIYPPQFLRAVWAFAAAFGGRVRLGRLETGALVALGDGWWCGTGRAGDTPLLSLSTDNFCHLPQVKNP